MDTRHSKLCVRVFSPPLSLLTTHARLQVEDLKAKIARELAALSKTASAKAVNNSEADELQERLQKDAAERARPLTQFRQTHAADVFCKQTDSKLLEKAVSLGKHFEEEAEADKAKLKETLARLAKEKAEDDAAAKVCFCRPRLARLLQLTPAAGDEQGHGRHAGAAGRPEAALRAARVRHPIV